MHALFLKSLFLFAPEHAHAIALNGLRYAWRFGFIRPPLLPTAPRTIMGLTFPNILGLAAGLDKNADYIDALAALGFNFIEIGTVTPQPQVGNTPPRLFRLVPQEAIINRMGFNNKGMHYVAQQLEKTRYRGILGINIGKNRDTPLAQAIDDYRACFRCLWQYASYITINVSSPNTPGLRELQQQTWLRDLLFALKKERQALVTQKTLPLVVKISPDLSAQALQDVADVLLEQEVDGVIATNTTIHRDGVEQSPYAPEAGGLSGKPLQARSTQVIAELATLVKGRIPIIGVGGIMDKASAEEKMAAGASLLQLYTGFIYRGPAIIPAILT